VGNENHGMACAGLIAATHNSIGIAGLAPNCKIMPIRIADGYGTFTSLENIAAAFDFTWDENVNPYGIFADVLSNSWGGDHDINDPMFVNFRQAVERAMTQGRNGKGCVVVFAAGNNPTHIATTATIPGVLTVGATDKSDNQQFYSPSGPEMDVVAPSGSVSMGLPTGSCPDPGGGPPIKFQRRELLGDVWTIDIANITPGPDQLSWGGWNDGTNDCPNNNWNVYLWSDRPGEPHPAFQYSAHFGGTSAACPQVAGLAALILSINPDYEEDQVRNIINNSADDLGPAGWDPDFGNGRINAYQALLQVVNDPFVLASQNKSTDPTATYSNSARHLVKGAGYLHEVFASGGEIFYRRSTDNGQSWNLTKKVTIPEQEGGNRAPCLTFYSYIPSEGPEINALGLVWERQIGAYSYEVWYSGSNAETINWSNPLKLATVTIDNTWQAGALPVVSHMSYLGSEIVVVVYCSGDGLYYRKLSDGVWSNAARIFSSYRVRYPSLSSGGNFISLLYDLRPYPDGVYSRRFDGSAWSLLPDTVAGPAITGTKYNRLPSIHVDPDGYLLAAWMGQIYEDGVLDPYYSIGLRRGFSNNTWDSWFVIFEHEPNVTSSEPSLTYYNKGGINNYGIKIAHGTYDNKIKELVYDIGTVWDEITVTNSGRWPNITEENFTSGDPIFLWTDQNGPPYTIQNNQSCGLPCHGGSAKLASFGKGESLGPHPVADFAHNRRGMIQHIPTGAFLTLDVKPIAVHSTAAGESILPFKSHSLIQPVNISLQNIDDYLGTDTLALPVDVQNLQWNWNATFASDQDSSGNTVPNVFSGKYQVLLRVKDVSNPAISTLVNITNIPQLNLNIQNFAGKAVIIKPETQLINLPAANLSFSVGDVYSPLPTVTNGKPASTPETDESNPGTFALETNYPNPFNPSTIIRYQVAHDAKVTLIIYNLLGQQVKTLVDGFISSGSHQVVWDGRNDSGEMVGSGIYFLKIVAQSGETKFVDNQKLMLMK